jgi:hypothetical protein
MSIKKELGFNQEFWWSIDEEFLMSVNLNIFVKILNDKMKNEYLFAQTSLLLGDVLVNRSIGTCLTLFGPDQVT